MLGSPIHLKDMRILMFQLSGFYYRDLGVYGMGFRAVGIPALGV